MQGMSGAMYFWADALIAAIEVRKADHVAFPGYEI